MPVFVAAGTFTANVAGEPYTRPCRAVDLAGDGVIGVTVGEFWFRNSKPGSFPPALAPAVKLDVAGVQCWFDVDQDGRLDAVIRENRPAKGVCRMERLSLLQPSRRWRCPNAPTSGLEP